MTLDPLQLVRVKLARMDCLSKAGFPAEAASALAGVLSGGGTPKTTGGYAGRRYEALQCGRALDGRWTVRSFDLSCCRYLPRAFLYFTAILSEEVGGDVQLNLS